MRPDETVRQYIISMQGLASHSDISECELVQFILDGLDDLGASASILYNANTIQELKDSLARYERRRTRTMANTPIVAPRVQPISTSARRPQSTSLPPRVTMTTAQPNLLRAQRDPNRCANCRIMGHQEANCNRPRRPPGSCFYCWENGHQFRECPKRRQTIAATTDDSPEGRV